MSCRWCRAAYRGRYPWTRASVCVHVHVPASARARARELSYIRPCACVRAREGRWNGGASDRGRSAVGDEGEASSLSRVRGGDRDREKMIESGKERTSPMRGAERERERDRGTGRGPKSGAIALSDVAISEYANHYLASAARTYLERERERTREREYPVLLDTR